MKWSAILFYLFTVRTYLENRAAVNDGAATERSYMEVSTRYANGFLNEYGQDLHKEEKTEYDFASELKNKMQEHSESKKETVDSRELYYRQISYASTDIKKAEDEPAQDVKMKNLGVGFLFVGGVGLGMSAGQIISDDSEDVIVRVKIAVGEGKCETVDVNLSEVDVRNASAVEMFAFCQYADSNGTGIDNKWGSWHALKQVLSASGNDLQYATLNDAVNEKRDWAAALASSGSVLKKEATGESISAADILRMLEENISKNANVKECVSVSEGEDKKQRYTITAFGPDGIISKEYCDGVEIGSWRIKYKNAGDYDKVMGFLNRFDNDINLAFAGSLKFWENFLNGDVKEEKLRVTHEAFFKNFGPNAPQSVKDAWIKAAQKVGVNNPGQKENGMMTHITQLDIQRFMQWNKGIYDTDVLGSTVESARSAVESALYALENPLSLSADISDEARAAKQKEREFYEEFLKLL